MYKDGQRETNGQRQGQRETNRDYILIVVKPPFNVPLEDGRKGVMMCVILVRNIAL